MQTTAVSVAEFALSAKVTELSADYNDPKLSDFQLPTTEVWAQSEELARTRTVSRLSALWRPLDLETPARPGRHSGRRDHGKSQKLTRRFRVHGCARVHSDDGFGRSAAQSRGCGTIMDPAPLRLRRTGPFPTGRRIVELRDLRVFDANGRTGTIKQARLSDFTLALSGKNDPVTQEFALVSSVRFVTAPYPHTQILLKSSLLNCYDRTTTTVNANVGLATNGASVSEIMGSGSAAMPNQKFTLKQSPLTFVQSPHTDRQAQHICK